MLRFGQWALLVAVACAATGCATTASKPTQDKAIAAPYRIDADDAVTVTIDAVPTVTMASDEKAHLQSIVTQKIDALRAQNPADETVRECRVAVMVTRFEKGSAFARAMLAGLGQIHLGADVTISDAAGATLQKFAVDKTFAWGGIYGASTRIEDLEPALADGVATGSTGKDAAVAVKK